MRLWLHIVFLFQSFWLTTFSLWLPASFQGIDIWLWVSHYSGICYVLSPGSEPNDLPWPLRLRNGERRREEEILHSISAAQCHCCDRGDRSLHIVRSLRPLQPPSFLPAPVSLLSTEGTAQIAHHLWLDASSSCFICPVIKHWWELTYSCITFIFGLNVELKNE